MKLRTRHVAIIGWDLMVAGSAWILAYWLRFNLDIPEPYLQGMLFNLPWVLVVHGITAVLFGSFSGMWRYVSIKDLQRIVMATGSAAMLVGAGVFMFKLEDVPRSVLLLQPFLSAMLMSGTRLAFRAWQEYRLYGDVRMEGEPTFIIGAGNAAMLLLRELKHSHEWRVVGLLDDDLNMRGSSIDGIYVLGPLEEIAKHALSLQVHHAIIAMPSASVAQRRRAAELATQAGLQALTVPSFEDILSGCVSISNVRRIELEDLLGRDRVQLDDEGLLKLLSGKVVMVTGAGGSIGAELSRQIAHFSPRLLIFFELSEYALYSIEQEFAGVPIRCVIGDVKDESRLIEAFATYRPDIVFHAAAYKHVPMMEGENSWEAVRNNVLGTMRLARIAASHGTGEFVLISTDKAVNPVNVMGASKRLAELLCQAIQLEHPNTRFVTVRFGNVLGSSGSVIPKFREQISRGGPITVTHPEIIRYFMLIPEAAQLVLQAGLLATVDSKGGRIFVLDMGEPIRIADLARDMIRLSGFSEDDIGIVYTGLRPGEKLYEELLADGESTLPTPHPKLRIMKPDVLPDSAWMTALEQWLAMPRRSEAEVKAGLVHWVPEYRPFDNLEEQPYG